MSASPTKDLAQHNNLGGIDLTGKNMDVSMGGAKTDFAMIPGMSEEKLKSAAGFVPVVMGMTTVINAADLVKPDL